MANVERQYSSKDVDQIINRAFAREFEVARVKQDGVLKRTLRHARKDAWATWAYPPVLPGDKLRVDRFYYDVVKINVGMLLTDTESDGESRWINLKIHTAAIERPIAVMEQSGTKRRYYLLLGSDGIVADNACCQLMECNTENVEAIEGNGEFARQKWISDHRSWFWDKFTVRDLNQVSVVRKVELPASTVFSVSAFKFAVQEREKLQNDSRMHLALGLGGAAVSAIVSEPQLAAIILPLGIALNMRLSDLAQRHGVIANEYVRRPEVARLAREWFLGGR